MKVTFDFFETVIITFVFHMLNREDLVVRLGSGAV